MSLSFVVDRSSFVKLAAVLTLALSPSVSMASSFQCEGSFAGTPASDMDKLLLESAQLFPQPQKFLMKTQTSSGSAIKVRIGRFGASPETFEEAIDLSKAKIEGVQSRSTLWEGEGLSLELHVREAATQNDVWKVSLASEMDAMAFLLATKFGLKTEVHEDHDARGFVVRAGVSQGRTAGLPKSMKLGTDFKVVGVSTVRDDLRQDSILKLRVQSVKTNDVFEIQASNKLAKSIAESILSKGELRVSLRGVQVVK